MDLLLDTNTLLWGLALPERLSEPGRAAITDPRNRVFVSAASVWEIGIKVSIGKLRVPEPLATWLPAELVGRRFTELAITVRHALEVERLPWRHRDPFDRLLIAQAIVDALTIVTGDSWFEQYDVDIIRC